MKKIYSFAASLMMAVMSFGQTYDLQLDLVSPVSQSSVAPGNISISFNLVNNGTDIVPGGDTLFFSYVINPQLGAGAQVFDFDGTLNGASGIILPPSSFPVGTQIPSAAFHTALGGPIVLDLSSYPTGTIVGISCWGANSPSLAGQDPRDSDMSNNMDLFTLNTGAVVTDPVYDLAVALINPVSQSTVPQSAAQTVEFTLTNNGPDAIPMGDTLRLAYVNQTQGTQYSLDGTLGAISLIILPFPISSGMSVSSNDIGIDPLNTTATGFNVGDVIVVVAEIAPDNDSDLSNNGDFFILGPTAGIENTTNKYFSVFPNPATDVLNISSSEEVSSVSVLSLDGKVISTTNEKQVDVSKLKAGVYIYEVTTAAGNKIINKFMKK